MRRNKRLSIISAITLILAFAGSCIFTNIWSNKSTASAYTVASSRTVYNFDYDWQFCKGQGYIDLCSNTDVDLESATYPTAQVVIPDNSETPVYANGFNISTYSANGATWESVSLPHTYNDTDTFDNYMEGSTNANRTAENDALNYSQTGERTMCTGTAWYKKTFTATSEMITGNEIYLEFEGARQACKIWVNGVAVTEVLEDNTTRQCVSENGFVPFGFNLTNYLVEGSNTITVWVNNSYEYQSTNYEYYDEDNNLMTSYLPWNDSHWQPTMGGLYRNAYLYVVNDAHLTLPLYSFLESEGTYIYTSNETATSADVNIKAEFENSTLLAGDYTIVAEILKADGSVAKSYTSVNSLSQTQTVAAGEKKIFTLSAQLSTADADLQFWSDEYPYQYTVKCYVVNSSGQIIDDNENQFGVRTFRFTSDEGFFLNENWTKLNGYGQKPTSEWAGLGSAYPDYLHDYVISLMKASNANLLRFGHCAGGPADLKACAKYGIMVIQPCVDGEGNYTGTGGKKYSNNPASIDVRKDAQRDMVIYYRNNPSIICWELGNQANVGYDVIDSLRDIIDTYDYGNRTMSTKTVNGVADTQIADNCGTYDNTANSVSSTRALGLRNCDKMPSGSTVYGLIDISFSTLGSGNTAGFPCIEAEYDRLEVRRGVWDDYTADYDGDGDGSTTFTQTAVDGSSSTDTGITGYSAITNENYAIGMVQSYISCVRKTSSCGGVNWIFSDSVSHGRILSEVSRTSGEVDGVMLEKQSYYVNQILFSDEKDVILLGHWNYASGTVKNVYAVARGAKSAKLYVNDVLVSSGVGSKFDGVDNLLWTFENVSYSSGTITVKCYDALNTEIATDSITSAGTGTNLKLTQVSQTLNAKANGSDVILIDVELLDGSSASAQRCIVYDGQVAGQYVKFSITDAEDNPLTFDNNGIVILRGGYNSAVAGSTNNDYLYLEQGINRVALRTTKTSGTIKIVVTMINKSDSSVVSGITGASLSITTGAQSNLSLCSTMPEMPSYSLALLEETTYGEGTKQSNIVINDDDPDIISIIPTLIDDADVDLYDIRSSEIEYDRMYEGRLLYKDNSTIRFETVPIGLTNSEFFRMNSSVRNRDSAEFLTFYPKVDCTCFILYDASVPAENVPNWITNISEGGLGATLVTGEHVFATDGTIYNIYIVNVSANSAVPIGKAKVDGNYNEDYAMMIVGMKRQSEYNANVFLLDDCTDETQIQVNEATNTSVDFVTYDGRSAMYMTDSNANPIDQTPTGIANMAWIQKSFSNLNGSVEISFVFNLPATNLNNIRIWINSAAMSYFTERTYIISELYIDNGVLGYTSFSKSLTTGSGVVASDRITVLDNDGGNITFNTGVWNTLKLILNTDSHTIDIYTAEGSNTVTLKRTGLLFTSRTSSGSDTPVYGSSISSICLGTPGSGVGNIYYDSITVRDLDDYETKISAVKLGDNPVASFDPEVTTYNLDCSSYTVATLPQLSCLITNLGELVKTENVYKDGYHKQLIYTITIDGVDNVYTFNLQNLAIPSVSSLLADNVEIENFNNALLNFDLYVEDASDIPTISYTMSDSSTGTITQTFDNNTSVLTVTITVNGFVYSYNITISDTIVAKVVSLKINGAYLGSFSSLVTDYTYDFGGDESLPVIVMDTSVDSNSDYTVTKSVEMDYENGRLIYTVLILNNTTNTSNDFTYYINLDNYTFLQNTTQIYLSGKAANNNVVTQTMVTGLLKDIYINSSNEFNVQLHSNLGIGSVMNSEGDVLVEGLNSSYLNSEFFTISKNYDEDEDNNTLIKFTPLVDLVLLKLRNTYYGHSDLEGWTKKNYILATDNGEAYFVYEMDIPKGVQFSFALSELYDSNLNEAVMCGFGSRGTINTTSNILNCNYLLEGLTLDEAREVFNRYFASTISEIAYDSNPNNYPLALGDTTGEIVERDGEYVYKIYDNDQQIACVKSELAPQTSKFEFETTVYLDSANAPANYVNGSGVIQPSSGSNSNANVNRYLRIWFFNGEPIDGYAQSGDMKSNVFLESYINPTSTSQSHPSTYVLSNVDNNSATSSILTSLPANKWIKFVYEVDILNHKYHVTAYVYDDYGNIINYDSTKNDIHNQAVAEEKNLCSVYNSGNGASTKSSSIAYVNYMQIASGRNACASAYIKDISMRSSNSGIVTDIKVNNETINGFSECDTTYYYNATNYSNIATATVSDGDLYRTVITDSAEKSTIVVQKYISSTWTDISKYSVFYIFAASTDELEEELALMTQLQLNQSTYNDYTSSSWSNYLQEWNIQNSYYQGIQSALNNTTQQEVDEVTTSLQTKRLALVKQTADKTTLNNLISTVVDYSTLTQSDYSTQLWTRYKTVYDNAVAVNALESPLRSQVGNAYNELFEEKDCLVPLITITLTAQQIITYTKEYNDSDPVLNITVSGEGYSDVVITFTRDSGETVGSYNLASASADSSRYVVVFDAATLGVNKFSITAKEVIVPTLNPAPFIYTGKTLVYKPLNYDSETTTLAAYGGTTSGVTYHSNMQKAVGTYKVKALLKSTNYIWSDGTSTPKYYDFTIANEALPDVTPMSSATYNGADQVPTVDLVNTSGVSLTLNTNYTIVWEYKSINADDSTYTTLDTSTNNFRLPGVYRVTATNNDTNYSGIKTATYTINKKALTITANNKTIYYKDNAPTYDEIYGTFISGESESDLIGTLTFSCDYDKTDSLHNGVNVYVISLDGLSSPYYEIEYIPGSLTVQALTIPAISSMASTYYNGSNQIPTVSIGDLVLSVDYTLSWQYKLIGADDNTYATLDTSLNNFKNAGVYKVTATGINNYIGTQVATYTIDQVTLAVTWLGEENSPSDFTFTYTGSSISPTASVTTGIGAETVELTITGAQTNVGSDITATASMTVTNTNYTLTNTTKTYNITAKEIGLTWSVISVENLVYSGTAKTVTATATGLIGTETCNVTVELTSGNNNVNVGTFTYTASGVSNTNYKLPGNVTSGNYTITAKEVVITWVADDFTYTGSDQKASVTATYKDISNADVSLTTSVEGTFTNYNASGYVFTASFANGETNYVLPATNTNTYNIKKADYNMSAVGFANAGKEYTGEAQSIEITGTLPTGLDSIQVTVSYSGSATNVSEGTKTITATFATTSTNYNVPTARTADLTITAKEIGLTWSVISAEDLVYSGTAKTVTATATGLIGTETCNVTVELTSGNNNVNVGTFTYTASGVSNTNYKLPGNVTSGNYTITAKEVVITWVADDFTYTGSDQKASVTATYKDISNADVSLTTSVEGTFTNYNASGYVFTASFANGETNYALPATNTNTYNIKKADYNMSAVGFANASKEYTGEAQSIEITGTLPTGLDSIQVTVSYSGSATNVSEGTKTITATFATTSTNYNVPTARTADLTITAKQLTISGTTVNDKTYDGITTATYALGVTSGKLGDDDVAVTVSSATFNSKNVGNDITVTIVYALSGEDAQNYNAPTEESLDANISACPITVTGLTVSNREYNASRVIVTSGTPALSGKIEGDDVSLSGTAVGSVENETVGDNKVVTISGLSLTGTDKDNYSLSLPTDITVNITQATTTITTDPTYSPKTTSKIIVGQDLSTIDIVGGVGNTDGTFSFNDTSLVLVNGENTVTLNFTPTDSTNYSSTSKQVIITASYITITFEMAPNKASYTGTLTPANISYGDSFVAPTLTAKTGYELKTENSGWDSLITTAVEDKTYVAQFNLITYSITLDAGSYGSFESTPAAVNYNIETSVAPILSSPTPQDGYVFDKWIIETPAGSWEEGDYEFTVGSFGNVTLVATYLNNAYRITFANGSGYVITAMLNNETEFISGGLVTTSDTITFEIEATTGYTVGTLSAHSTNYLFTFEDNVLSNICENVTISGSAIANIFGIRFNGVNINSGNMENISATYDAPLTLPANMFIRTGYSFAGWAESSTGEILYTDEYTFTVEQINALYSGISEYNYDLYTIFTVNVYTLTLHANYPEANPETDTQQITFGSSDTINTNIFTRDYYTFAGWAESSNGEAVYALGIDNDILTTYEMWTTGADLYAVWRANEFTITFENGTGYTISAVLSGESFVSGSTITVESGAVEFTLTALPGYIAGELSANSENNHFTFEDNALSNVTENVTITGSATALLATNPTITTHPIGGNASYGTGIVLVVAVSEVENHTPEYAWYVNDILIPNSNTPSYNTDPEIITGTLGSYYCKVRLIRNDNGLGSEYVQSNTADVTVIKGKIDKPTNDNTTFVYNGVEQVYMPVGFDGNLMEITNNNQINANTSGYNVVVSIKDKSNYEWADSTQTNIPFSFIIGKATPVITSEQTFSNVIYVGQNISEFSLNAQANVPGLFRWKISNLRILQTTNNVRYVFTPTDTTNYISIENQVSISPTCITLSIPQGVNVVGSDNGTITNGGNVYFNEVLTFTLDTPTTGYEKDTFTINSTPSDSGAHLTVNSPDINIVYTTRKIIYTITKDETNEDYFSVAATGTISESILVTLNPQIGYEIDELYYRVANNDTNININKETLTFSMPNSNITVFATFKLSHFTISYIEENYTITLSPQKDYYLYSESVTVTIETTDSSYEIKGFSILNSNSEDVALVNNTFAMPNSNVTIEVEIVHHIQLTPEDSSEEEVVIETYEGFVPNAPQVKLYVEEQIEETTTYENVKNDLQSDVSKFVAYEITLKNGEDIIEEELDDAVTIKIIIPQGLDRSNLIVYRYNNNDTKTIYTLGSSASENNFVIDGDYVVFKTNHFSVYVIAEKFIAPPPDMTIVFILVAVGAVVIIGVLVAVLLVVKKRHSYIDNHIVKVSKICAETTTQKKSARASSSTKAKTGTKTKQTTKAKTTAKTKKK